MTKHKQFFMGVLFAATAGLGADFLLVHQWADHHHLYEGPSVDVVEPVLAVILIIFSLIVLKKEFKG